MENLNPVTKVFEKELQREYFESIAILVLFYAFITIDFNYGQSQAGLILDAFERNFDITGFETFDGILLPFALWKSISFKPEALKHPTVRKYLELQKEITRDYMIAIAKIGEKIGEHHYYGRIKPEIKSLLEDRLPIEELAADNFLKDPGSSNSTTK